MNTTGINWKTGVLSIDLLVSMKIAQMGGSSLRTFSLEQLDKIHSKGNKELSELLYSIFNNSVSQYFRIDLQKAIIALKTTSTSLNSPTRSYDIQELIELDSNASITHHILKRYLTYNFSDFIGESLFEYFEKVIQYRKTQSAFKYYRR